METKQVIVLRKDLNMRKGKMVSQGAHASLAAILNMMTTISVGFDQDSKVRSLTVSNDDAIGLWLDNSFTKICVSVDSEEDLLDIYKKAQEEFIPCSLIKDNGKTEFGGVATYTAIAVGPGFSDEIDKITGHLKLL